MSELKSCPFCGCSMRIETGRDTGHRMYGDHTQKCVFPRNSSTATEISDHPDALIRLIEDWNTRAALAQEAVKVEPVARMHTGMEGDCCIWFSRPADGTFLYTSPPAPVPVPDKYDDVLLPFLALMRSELHANAHKGDRPGWLQMDSKTAILEVFYHMGKLHQAVHRGEEAAIKEYAADVANMCMMLVDICACLDKVKELNQ